MFWRVCLSALALAVARLGFEIMMRRVDGFELELFAPSAFASLTSCFFIISGLISSNVLQQYSEAERLVDDVHSNIHSYFDNVIVAIADSDDKMQALAELDPVTVSVQNFVRSWAESVRLPATGSTSGDSAMHRARASLNEIVVAACRAHGSSSAADHDFRKETVKVVAAWGKAVTRIETIRRTVVLASAQNFQHVLLVLVLASLFVTDFNVHWLIVEFLIVFSSAACVILVQALAQQLDDPFCSSLDSLVVFSVVERVMSFVSGDGGGQIGRRRRRRRRGGGSPASADLTFTEGDDSGADNSPSSSPAAASSPSTARGGAAGSPLFSKHFEQELDAMQISVAPLIKALRRRTRALKKL